MQNIVLRCMLRNICYKSPPQPNLSYATGESSNNKHVYVQEKQLSINSPLFKVKVVKLKFLTTLKTHRNTLQRYLQLNYSHVKKTMYALLNSNGCNR